MIVGGILQRFAWGYASPGDLRLRLKIYTEEQDEASLVR
jgi:hypothetical protein